jgi:hypothetical protein
MLEKLKGNMEVIAGDITVMEMDKDTEVNYGSIQPIKELIGEQEESNDPDSSQAIDYSKSLTNKDLMPNKKDYDGTTFVHIDRGAENKKVMKFQKTGDINLLGEIYLTRLQTIQIWARKHAYLSHSAEDMEREFTCALINACHGYDGSKKEVTLKSGKTVSQVRQFNTYLYRSLLNRIRNIVSYKKAKKRRPVGMEDSICDVLLSLDYNYNNKDGSDSTLKDIVSESIFANEEDVVDKIAIDEVLNLLSKDDPPYVKDFFKKVSNGNSIASALRDQKTFSGRIKLNKGKAEQLDQKRRCNRIASQVIAEKAKIESDFDLQGYYIDKSYLYYTIEMKKTEESDYIVKKLRKLKKNRDYYIRKIAES